MAGTGKKRVLVADDRKTMRTMLASTFEAMACEIVAQAENGQEAVALFLETRPNERPERLSGYLA